MSGSSLNSTDGIVITPPAGYEIGQGATPTYSTSAITVVQTSAGAVATTTISVRLTNATTTAGSPYSGNITHTSTNATTVNKAVSGTVTAAPTVTTTAPATGITATAATIAGNITNLGSPTTSTSYGFVYSTTASTAATLVLPASGTVTAVQVGTTGAATGAYSTNLAGLTASTTYYYRAYASNSTGTGYGTVESFTTAAPPTTPSLTPSTTALTGFNYYVGAGPSASQSFNLTGSNLTAGNDISISAAGTDYEVSTDNSAFGATATITNAAGGTLASTPVYVRLKAGLAAASYANETVSITGGGTASATTVTVSGSVTALPTITTGTVTPSSVVQGSSVTVAYTTSGTFGTGNVFSAELSDASGAYPGTALAPTASGTGSLTVTIPAATTPGTSYTIRVLASNPATVGSASGAFAVTAPIMDSQLLLYSFNSTATNANAPTPPTPAANTTGSDFASGTGVTQTSTIDVFGTNGYNTTTATRTAPSATEYLTFTFAAGSPYVASLTELSFKDLASGTGPTNTQVFYSLNSNFSSSVQIGTSAVSSAALTTRTFLLTGVAGLQNVAGPIYFRIFPYGATGGSGSYRVDDVALRGIVNPNPGPYLVTTPSTLSNFTYIAGSGPSASQSYSLSGANLTAGNLTVTGSTNYEVSADNSTFGASATISNPTGGTLSGTPVYVRLKAGLTAASYNGQLIANNGGGAPVANVTVSGTVTPSPTISVLGTLNPFNTLAGTVSAVQTVGVQGSNLVAGIDITPPAGYEVSIDGGTSYSTATQTLGTGGNISNTTVRLRLTGLTPTASLGTVLMVRSQSAPNQDRTVSGTVVAEPVAPAPTVSVGTVTNSTAVLTLGAGTGTNLLVVVRPAAATAVAPTDGTTYPAAAAYGSANTTGTSNYVVFADVNTTSITVTGLSATTSYVADVYSYNVGTVVGFENYLPTAGSSSTFTTPIQPFPAPGLLVLEDDFDYAPATLTTHGWSFAPSSSGTTISTVAGNVLSSTHPQGAALSGAPAATSTKATMVPAQASIYRGGTRPTGSTTLYTAAVVNFSNVQNSGDYFLANLDATATTPSYRSRVYGVKTATGLFKLGIAVGSEPATYEATPTQFSLGTSYVLVVKTENSAATANKDVASLFVLPINSDLRLEPTTPLVTATATATLASTLNAVLLRQTGSNNASLTIDGIRLATGWGAAVGRPVYTDAAPASIEAGNYYDLTVNNGDVLTPNGAVRLERGLTLTSGKIATTATNSLTLSQAATVTGGSSTSYVNGPVLRPIDVIAATATPPSFTFPVGQGNFYRPITLSITEHKAASTYTSTQTEGNSSRALSTDAGKGTAPLARVSSKRFYTVNSSNTTAGNFTGTITLSFGAEDYVNVPSSADFVIAKRDATGTSANQWTNLGRSTNTGTGSGAGGPSVAGTLTSASFSDFSDFALGAQNDLSNTNVLEAINPLPVQLTAFSAQRQADQTVAVKWATASEKNSAHFNVQRSLDGREFATIATTTAQGSTTQATAYGMLDKAAPTAVLYYRLRQVDRDGTVAFSPVATVAGSASSPTEWALYPNPATDRLALAVPAAEGRTYRVLNTLGQVVASGPATSAEPVIDLHRLAAGTYFLELRTATGPQLRRFVKQN